MNSEPLQAITSDQIEAYQKDGVVCLRAVGRAFSIGLVNVVEPGSSTYRFPHRSTRKDTGGVKNPYSIVNYAKGHVPQGARFSLDFQVNCSQNGSL